MPSVATYRVVIVRYKTNKYERALRYYRYKHRVIRECLWASKVGNIAIEAFRLLVLRGLKSREGRTQPAPKYHTKGCSHSSADSRGARTLVFAAFDQKWPRGRFRSVHGPHPETHVSPSLC